MNANQLINMVVRMVLRPLIGRGVNAGIDYATRNRKAPTGDAQADRAQQAEARQNGRRARQAMRVVRRIGRF